MLLGARWGPSADIWSVACVVRCFDSVLLAFSPHVVDHSLASYLNSSLAGITSLTHKQGHATPRTRITSPRSWSLSANSPSPLLSPANTVHASSTVKVRCRIPSFHQPHTHPSPHSYRRAQAYQQASLLAPRGRASRQVRVHAGDGADDLLLPEPDGAP